MRLALLLLGARGALLETAAGSLEDGELTGEPTEVPIGRGTLVVFGGRSDPDALALLVRRFDDFLMSDGEARARDEEHGHALATAERANEIARSAARRFEALFEGLPVACYACDVGGRLVE